MSNTVESLKGTCFDRLKLKNPKIYQDLHNKIDASDYMLEELSTKQKQSLLKQMSEFKNKGCMKMSMNKTDCFVINVFDKKREVARPRLPSIKSRTKNISTFGKLRKRVLSPQPCARVIGLRLNKLNDLKSIEVLDLDRS